MLAEDSDKILHTLVFQQFSGPIRTLIGNKFVFEPFWRALREHDSNNRWETSFSASHKATLASIMQGDTATVLSIVFDRLYVLRNQLVHGGATSEQEHQPRSKVGVRILATIGPTILTLTLKHSGLSSAAAQLLHPAERIQFGYAPLSVLLNPVLSSELN